MKVRRSRLEVLTILDFVDLWGADATTEKYGVDGRTLKRWQEREPSGWQREEEVNRLLMIEKRAAGKFSYRDLVVGAGVAADKIWRQADRLARAARQEGQRFDECDCVLPPGWVPELHPKAGTPEHAAAVWQIAATKMDGPRRHFMQSLRPLLAFLIDHEDGDTKLDIPESREATQAALAGIPNADGDQVASMQQWIASLDDDTLAARQAHVDRAYEAYRTSIHSELQRRWDAEAAVAGHDASGTPEAEASDDSPIPEPTPLPTARAARPAHAPIVLDVGSPDHDRGWRPWDTRDSW